MLTSEPPAIPRSRTGRQQEADEHLLLWVRTGSARVRVGTDEEHRVDAGSGLWLPPGTEHELWTDPGTVALPMSAPADLLSNAPDRVVAFAVPDAAQRSLVASYSQWAWDENPALATASPLPDLSEVLTEHGSREHQSSALHPPSGPAARVAAELNRQPHLDRSLEEWAAWAACSPSTLRRGFLRQTGLTFAQWRQLTRAVDATPADAIPGEQAVPAHPDQPGRPLTHNVMLWVREGALRADFAGRRWVAGAGDVVWLPAGSRVEQRPRWSIPLSVLCTECAQLDRPQRVRFSRAWHDWLLWASVGTCSLLRPEQHHGRSRERRALHSHVVDAFTAQLAVHRARVVPQPVDPAARAAASAFLGALGTVAERTTHQAPPEVRASFRRETGMSFDDWRQAARMRLARHLLLNGTPSSRVANRVGYSLGSNFSRAFSRFHGVGPREFQALEAPDELFA